MGIAPRLQPEKAGDPDYRQIWRVVDGAVRAAFEAHPEYLAPKASLRTVRNSIVKRVTGAIHGYAEQSAWGRSGFSPAAESAGAADMDPAGGAAYASAAPLCMGALTPGGLHTLPATPSARVPPPPERRDDRCPHPPRGDLRLRLYGVQFGSWFVGAVQGGKDPACQADTALSTQIVRLLDAIENRHDPLSYSEPLVKAARGRYCALRDYGRDEHGHRYDFDASRRISRAEAVAALIARGTPLVEPEPAPAEVAR